MYVLHYGEVFRGKIFSRRVYFLGVSTRAYFKCRGLPILLFIFGDPTAACDNNIILRELYYHNLDRTIWLEIIFTPACTDVRKIKPQLDSASEC